MSEMARATARGSPFRTRSASASADRDSDIIDVLAGPRPRSLQELARDDEALDLAGSLADGRQLHIAEEFLGRVVFHESVAAVNLHAVFGGSDGNLAGVEFRH